MTSHQCWATSSVLVCLPAHFKVVAEFEANGFSLSRGEETKSWLIHACYRRIVVNFRVYRISDHIPMSFKYKIGNMCNLQLEVVLSLARLDAQLQFIVAHFTFYPKPIYKRLLTQ